MNGYENLANAIILRATKDYRITAELLNKNPNDRTAKAEQRKIEKFFRSDYFTVLTDLDGEKLLMDLRDDIERTVCV